MRIKSREFLLEFKRTWKFHHPLEDLQLDYAGQFAMVIEVGFYFGGDELYTLKDVPGIWNEGCLEQADNSI